MTSTEGATPAPTAAAPDQLPARFGIGTATFVVISSMVGTGVLTTSGFTVFYTGSNQLMLWLWVLGGLVALCGALSLAELAAALPRTGGDYVFLYEAFGPLVAFLSGWVSFFIGFGAPIAASAFAAAKYFVRPLDPSLADSIVLQQVIATVAIVLMSIVHVSGHHRSIRVQGVTTVVKMAVLGLLAIAGVVAGRGNLSNLADRPPMSGGVLQSMAFSLVFIAYAYTGWNGAAYLAGEIENPQKRLPRAILLGTGLVLALYLVLNLMYALAISSSDLKAMVPIVDGEPKVEVVAPIAEIASRRLFGPRAADVLSIAVGLTMLASLSAFVLTGPRVAYAMARAGQFPGLFGRVAPNGTPALATALQAVWAIVLLWSNRFESIMIYAGVGLSLFAMLAIAAVYVLRWRRPELERPFRTPGYPLTPALFLLVTGALIYATFIQQPDVTTFSVLSILAGVPVYYLGGFRQRPAT